MNYKPHAAEQVPRRGRLNLASVVFATPERAIGLKAGLFCESKLGVRVEPRRDMALFSPASGFDYVRRTVAVTRERLRAQGSRAVVLSAACNGPVGGERIRRPSCVEHSHD